MKFAIKLLIVALVSYFVGNLSPSIILGKLAGVDIKSEGSGNAGTTNALRVLGLRAAIITLIIDILKGYIPVKIALGVAGIYAGMVAFVFVVLGHVFPVIYHFKGGKGVATALGCAFAINWPSGFAALIIGVIAIAITRKVSVGSLTAAVFYPMLVFFFDSHYLWLSLLVFVFLICTHIPNIKRLLDGEEPEINVSNKVKKFLAADDENESFSENKIPSSGMNEISPTNYYASVKIPELESKSIKNVSVIGSGSFGTAIANLLAYNGHNVLLYGRNRDDIELMTRTHINNKYLPNIILCEKLRYTPVLKTAVKDKDVVIFAVPTQQFREVLTNAKEYLDPSTILVNLAKGIEQESLKRMSEIAAEIIPQNKYVVVSGPSHAEEVVRNFPTSVVAASKDSKSALAIQDLLMNDNFRVYTASDVIGVEVAGALKNVIAIATGICDGMKLGNNARTALMTRAEHEISRLGVKLGADKETFAGLAGIGDLIVTCTTNLSRNRRCGLLIGVGFDPDKAVNSIGSTCEGYYTAEAAALLAQKHKVDMPICKATNAVINRSISASDVVKELMTRERKAEKQ